MNDGGGACQWESHTLCRFTEIRACLNRAFRDRLRKIERTESDRYLGLLSRVQLQAQ